MKEVSMYDYWGKADGDSYHLLVYHCLDVAAVGKVWLEESPAFTKRVAEASGLSETAFVEWFTFFLALHDIGKFDVRFQNLRPDLLKKLQNKESSLPYSPRHDQRGFEYWNKSVFTYLYDTYFSELKSVKLKTFLDSFALVTLGHHGVPPKSTDSSIKVSLDVINFIDKIFTLFISSKSQNELRELITLPKKERKEIATTLKHTSWQLAGLTTLCDWIASGDEAFQFETREIELDGYFTNSCVKAKEAVTRAEIISSPLSLTIGINRLFPKYADTPTPLQIFCNETEITSSSQMWILEDVAGAGKTEAALVLASRILAVGGGSGCFVALPTMATSNAMYERMANVYSLLFKDGSRPSLSLSHGSRHLSETFSNSYKTNLNDLPDSGKLFNEESDEGKAHCSQWLADSSKKALLSDVGVGTIDQILMAGLPVRYQSLRAFGMAQKILIIDEVHSFDAYMLQLLINVISAQAAFGGSVILLSATLPQSVRGKFCGAFLDGLNAESFSIKEAKTFPLVTGVTNRGIEETGVETRSTVAREVEVSFCEEINDVYSLIEKSVSEGKCVCWIRNTISDVTDSFNELQERNIEKLEMFHSRFTLQDRLAIEQRVVARFGKESTKEERAGQVLVASQVVEQSLDLDFDVMISDLAPIDLLIQRAGRLHRHQRGEREKPVFYVHSPKETDSPTENWFSDAFPKAQYVYKDVALLWRTKEILKQQMRFKMPEEARLLIEAVYSEEGEPTPDVFVSAEDSAWADMLNQKSIANFNRLSFEQDYSRMSSDANKWESEERVSTRLSDPTNKLYLCKWIDRSLVPLNDGGKYSWDLSSLSMRKSALVSIEYSNEINKSIEELQTQKRFKYDTLFVVFPDENFELLGVDDRARKVLIRYSHDGGLLIDIAVNE
ncbi:MAG: hypothetical protein B6229_02165 [Spirochaetaceae bacterium 4572_7]|nr:MAG: hypothetical protein B6229_02165 [Spirochaetaceae bacterium 4572_7]